MDTTQTIRIVIDARGAKSGSDEVRRGLRDVRDETQRAATALERMEKTIGIVGSTMKVHLALYAAEAAARLGGMARDSFNAASGLDELAEQLGITNRGLQALQFTAAQSGLKVEQLETGIGKFSQKMGEAADGSKEMIEAMERLGIKNLDVQGKLRPTEDLLQDVAGAIVAIEDPAKRAAAAVDFFGKAGTRMLPMLKDIADGTDVMAGKAAAAGAMISERASKRLDEMADAMERNRLKTRAFIAEGLVGLADWVQRNSDWLKPVVDVATLGISALVRNFDSVSTSLAGATTAVADFFDDYRQKTVELGAAGNGLLTSFLKSFETLPSKLRTIFVDAVNAAIGAVEEGSANISRNAKSWFREKPAPVTIPRLSGGTTAADPTDPGGPVDWYQVGANEYRAHAGNPNYRAQRAEQRALENVYWFWERESQGAGPTPGGPATTGDSLTKPKPTGGETPESKYTKLITQLENTVRAQDAMAAAAQRGDQAFEEQKVKADALSKSIDIFGAALEATDPRLIKIEDNLRRIATSEATKTFALQTTELQKQNEVLAVQIRLIDAAPDVIARETAAIKARQDAQKAGGKISQEDIDNRRKAYEQGELLRQQSEQLRQANELWTAPLRQALQNIQTGTADVYERMLDGAVSLGEGMADVFKRTAKRIAAEMLALATIRPVMSIMLQAVGPQGLGIVGGGTLTQMGFPVAASGEAGAASSGGGLLGGINSISGGGLFGGGSLFGGGGGLFGSGGMLSGVGNFLSSPIFGPITTFSGNTATTAVAGVPAFMQSGAAGAAGASGSSFFNMGGLTWGQGLGGLASIGMGAMNAFSGKGTGSTIGGIAQMAGGVMMMIPGLQPFGAALSLLGGLGGMFDGGPKIPEMPGLGYSVGPVINAGAPGVVSDLIRRTGGRGIGGRLYGGSVGGGTTHTWNGSQWVGQQYSQGYLVAPDGSSQMISGTGANISQQDAADKLAFQIFRSDVMKGAVEGITDTLAKIFDSLKEGTVQAAADAVDFAKAYDRLGKTANPVKDAIDALNAKLGDLSSKAEGYGLALDPIDAELAKQTKRTAQDFIDGLLDPLAVQMRALQDERESALASAEYIRDHIEGVYVDMDRIATYYTNKEAALRDQFYQGGLSNLQTIINRLTYGDLAGASPTLQLSGTKASYMAALAQAQSGNASAIANLGGLAENYLTAGRQYFASSPEYAALVESIRQALQEVVVAQTGGVAAPASGAPTPQQTVTGQQIAQLTAVTEEQARQNDQLRAELRDLKDLLQRYVTVGRAA